MHRLPKQRLRDQRSRNKTHHYELARPDHRYVLVSYESTAHRSKPGRSTALRTILRQPCLQHLPSSEDNGARTVTPPTIEQLLPQRPTCASLTEHPNNIASSKLILESILDRLRLPWLLRPRHPWLDLMASMHQDIRTLHNQNRARKRSGSCFEEPVGHRNFEALSPSHPERGRNLPSGPCPGSTSQ